MSVEVVLATVIGVVALVVLVGVARRRPDRVQSLRREFIKLMRLGPAQGQAHLTERLDALMANKPGHSLEWYLQWLVDDLRRSKR